MSIRSFALQSNRRIVGASLSSRTCRANLVKALILTFLFVQFGCAASKKVQLPEVVGDNPKAAELIQAVNENAAKIKTIYAPSASVGFNNLPNYASCQLVFESPNKFRLRGSVSLAGQVVDCGCDGTDFWYWGRYQNPDELYYCKLDEYTGSALSDYMPVDPSWFPEALGVDAIKESDILDEPQEQQDGTLLVTLKKERADGSYRKRIYFEPRTAAVARQDVQAPNGDVVVSVVCREQQYVESPGVVLPKKLEITCSQTGETLVVDLGTVTLNEANTISTNAFQRPTDLNVHEVDVGAAMKKKSLATTVKPAEKTPPAEVVRPAETTQAIEKTRAVESKIVAPAEKQTDDSGATWTSANPAQFSQPSTAPNVVAAPAANPGVTTNNASNSSVSQTNVVSSFAPGSAAQAGSQTNAQTNVQKVAANPQPFVLEGTGAPLNASNGSYKTSQASANPTNGIMIAKPSTSSDSGVTPFPTNLNEQTTTAQTSLTTSNETNDYADAIPISSEPRKSTTPRVVPPTLETQTSRAASNSSAQVGDLLETSQTPAGNASTVESTYETSEPIDNMLLEEDFPTF